MILKSIDIENFRNIERASLEFGEKLNLVYGPNASGKTSLLEAIFFLLTGRSIRGARESLLIKKEHDYSRLVGDIITADEDIKIEIGFDGKGKKNIKIDGVLLQRLSKLIEISAVVSVSSEDVEIASGPPDNRRRFMDSVLSHCFPVYLSSLMEYGKTLKQKNALLKDSPRIDKSQINIWNKQLAKTGSTLVNKRLDFVQYLKAQGAGLYKRLSPDEEIKFVYKTRYGDEFENDIIKGIFDALNDNLQREIRLQQAIVGPHRDDISIHVDGKSIRSYGSRGQQKCAMLSMKFASLEYMENIRGEKPLLLLDEAVSELDTGRSANLLTLSKSIGQVLMASARGIERTEDDGKTLRFRIEQGRIERVM
ncbi:MAG: DNA replication and repair protein RecF [candidate division Zixibacteria bacterium]|nr:DNA replication and repair protein RecF [candidate division Zixibacteria bacterium]